MNAAAQLTAVIILIKTERFVPKIVANVITIIPIKMINILNKEDSY